MKSFAGIYSQAKSVALLSLFGLAGLISACSTDVELNTKSQPVPIVYSILVPDSSFQYIRLSRLFQNSDGRSALDIAKNDPAAYTYAPDEWDLTLYSVAGRDTFELTNFEQSEIENKSLEGDFAGPRQTIYRSTQQIAITGTREVNGQQRPLVYLLKGVNAKNGQVFSCSTSGIGPFSIAYPNSDEGIDNPVAFTFDPQPNGGRTSAFVTIGNPPIGKATQKFNLEVNYEETYRSGNTVAKSFLIQGVGTLNGLISSGEFFGSLKSQVNVDTNVVKRKFLFGEVQVFYGNQDFSNYLDVLNNYNPITQIQPTYNNINGGIGLLAFRRSRVAPVRISSETVSNMNAIRGNAQLYPELAALKFTL